MTTTPDDNATKQSGDANHDAALEHLRHVPTALPYHFLNEARCYDDFFRNYDFNELGRQRRVMHMGEHLPLRLCSMVGRAHERVLRRLQDKTAATRHVSLLPNGSFVIRVEMLNGTVKPESCPDVESYLDRASVTTAVLPVARIIEVADGGRAMLLTYPHYPAGFHYACLLRMIANRYETGSGAVPDFAFVPWPDAESVMLAWAKYKTYSRDGLFGEYVRQFDRPAMMKRGVYEFDWRKAGGGWISRCRDTGAWSLAS